MTTDDAAVRALIAAVRADRTLSRSDLALNLAHAAEALLAGRGKVRGAVAEEIAEAIESDGGFEHKYERDYAARIAREHGTKEVGQ